MDINIVVDNDKKTIKDAFLIRKTVFVEEQGFYDELDSVDDIAFHAVAYDGDKVIGCGRMFSENNNSYHIGRIAVLDEYRNSGIGSAIMSSLEEKAASLNAECVVLSAQRRAFGFYIRLGYEPVGDEYLEEGYPHTFMRKKL